MCVKKQALFGAENCSSRQLFTASPNIKAFMGHGT